MASSRLPNPPALVNNAPYPPETPPAHRGRAPKDPLEVVAAFECASLDDFKICLGRFLDAPPTVPEHATGEFRFWLGASFIVSLPSFSPSAPAPTDPAPNGPPAQNGEPPANSSGPNTYKQAEDKPLAVLEVLDSSLTNKDKMIKQKAVARAIVAAISKVDGFRYTFQNDWLSREDEAYRFSFYCNDSLLNKDRAANRKMRGRLDKGKRAIKPVYDCRGVLAVKFSCTKQSLEVIYKHNPIHDTYEARAPPPRKEAKRRAEWEQQNPDKVRQREDSPGREQRQAEKEERLKRKAEKEAERAEKKRRSEVSAEHDLLQESMRSLLELIQPAPEATPAQASPAAPTEKTAKQRARAEAIYRPRDARLNCDPCIVHGDRCEHQRPNCRACTRNGRTCTYSCDAASMTNLADSQSAPQQPTVSPEFQISDPVRAMVDKYRDEITELKTKLAQAEEHIRYLEGGNAPAQVAPETQGAQESRSDDSESPPLTYDGLQQLARHVQEANAQEYANGQAQNRPWSYQSSISRSAYAHDQRQNNSPQQPQGTYENGQAAEQPVYPTGLPSNPAQDYDTWRTQYGGYQPASRTPGQFINSDPTIWRAATMRSTVR